VEEAIWKVKPKNLRWCSQYF